ncbi:MAG: transglutaminase family protein [Acidimicrobiia bacterium]|nr:transglutaminase family protein [Acidimicrobiia bacterium]
MRMTIRYLSTYTYDGVVSESQNALRAKPMTNARQTLLSYSVTVDPPALVYSYTDYWGTQVDCFGVIDRHTRLTVVADSVVQTSIQPAPLDAGSWPLQGEPTGSDVEYLAPSPHVLWDERVKQFGNGAVDGETTLVGAARAVQKAVGSLLSYESGSTDVGVSVAEVFEQRAGVCQDYAHLSLAIYRSLGIPARYVSGYLYAADASLGDQPEADEVEVSTHAWVEVLTPGNFWWGLDPTNQLEVGEQHVKIGHGRDYEDVMPLRGTYHGQAESGGLEAGVHMSRANLDPYTMQPRPASKQRRDSQQQQQQ